MVIDEHASTADAVTVDADSVTNYDMVLNFYRADEPLAPVASFRIWAWYQELQQAQVTKIALPVPGEGAGHDPYNHVGRHLGGNSTD